MDNNTGLLDIIIDKFGKIDNNLIRIEERLNAIDKTLVKQEANLEEHMKRSDMLEAELRPVKRHVTMVESVFKFIGAISVLVGIAASLVKVFA